MGGTYVESCGHCQEAAMNVVCRIAYYCAHVVVHSRNDNEPQVRNVTHDAPLPVQQQQQPRAMLKKKYISRAH